MASEMKPPPEPQPNDLDWVCRGCGGGVDIMDKFEAYCSNCGEGDPSLAALWGHEWAAVAMMAAGRSPGAELAARRARPPAARNLDLAPGGAMSGSFHLCPHGSEHVTSSENGALSTCDACHVSWFHDEGFDGLGWPDGEPCPRSPFTGWCVKCDGVQNFRNRHCAVCMMPYHADTLDRTSRG